MNWPKHHFSWKAALLMAAFIGGLETWGLQRFRQRAVKVTSLLMQKREEAERLARQSPALVDTNEQVIVEGLAADTMILADLRDKLQPRATRDATIARPATSTEAYFDLTAFVEKMRALAAQTGVALQTNERFG